LKSNRDFIEGIYQKAQDYPFLEKRVIKLSLPEVVRKPYQLGSDRNKKYSLKQENEYTIHEKSDFVLLYCFTDVGRDKFGNLSGFHSLIILIIHRL